MPLTVTLNGKSQSFAALEPTATLTALVEELALKPDRIAIELNGEIAPRSGWSSLQVASGDRVELVHFVGGGTSPAC